MPESPETASCPTCGSTKLNWRLHRFGKHNQPGVARELAWSCRDCDGHWTEPAGPSAATPLGG